MLKNILLSKLLAVVIISFYSPLESYCSGDNGHREALYQPFSIFEEQGTQQNYQNSSNLYWDNISEMEPTHSLRISVLIPKRFYNYTGQIGQRAQIVNTSLDEAKRVIEGLEVFAMIPNKFQGSAIDHFQYIPETCSLIHSALQFRRAYHDKELEDSKSVKYYIDLGYKSFSLLLGAFKSLSVPKDKITVNMIKAELDKVLYKLNIPSSIEEGECDIAKSSGFELSNSSEDDPSSFVFRYNQDNKIKNFYFDRLSREKNKRLVFFSNIEKDSQSKKLGVIPIKILGYGSVYPFYILPLMQTEEVNNASVRVIIESFKLVLNLKKYEGHLRCGYSSSQYQHGKPEGGLNFFSPIPLLDYFFPNIQDQILDIANTQIEKNVGAVGINARKADDIFDGYLEDFYLLESSLGVFGGVFGKVYAGEVILWLDEQYKKTLSRNLASIIASPLNSASAVGFMFSLENIENDFLKRINEFSTSRFNRPEKISKKLASGSDSDGSSEFLAYKLVHTFKAKLSDYTNNNNSSGNTTLNFLRSYLKDLYNSENQKVGGGESFEAQIKKLNKESREILSQKLGKIAYYYLLQVNPNDVGSATKISAEITKFSRFEFIAISQKQGGYLAQLQA